MIPELQKKCGSYLLISKSCAALKRENTVGKNFLNQQRGTWIVVTSYDKGSLTFSN